MDSRFFLLLTIFKVRNRKWNFDVILMKGIMLCLASSPRDIFWFCLLSPFDYPGVPPPPPSRCFFIFMWRMPSSATTKGIVVKIPKVQISSQGLSLGEVLETRCGQSLWALTSKFTFNCCAAILNFNNRSAAARYGINRS